MIWLFLLALALPTALVLLVLAAARPKTDAFVRRGRIIFFAGAVIVGVAQIAIGIVKLWHPPANWTKFPPWFYYSSAVWSVLCPVLFLALFWRNYRRQTWETVVEPGEAGD